MSRCLFPSLLAVALCLFVAPFRGLAGQPVAASADEQQLIAEAGAALAAHQPIEALKRLKILLKAQPEHVKARFLVSNALATIGREKDALEVLENLAKDYPDDYSVLNNLAWMLCTAEDSTLRDPRRAVMLARRALMFAPENYNVWSTLAEAYYRAGYYDRALKAAEQAARLAVNQKAPEMNLVNYEEQVTKCRSAVSVFSLID